MMSLALIVSALAAQSAPQPINVPVQNPSFEQLPNSGMTTETCFDEYRDKVPAGWSWTYSDPIWGGIAVLNPLPSNPCLISAAPDGSWVLFVASSTVVQDTGIKPSNLQTPGVGGDTGRYVMTFWVANYDTVYPGYYEVAVLFGTHELCSIDGWATQHFRQITLPCDSPDYLLGNWPDGSGKADPDAHIIISLSHTKGWPLLFDNVSLTFTPTN